MNRRAFITLLGGAAAWPIAAGAQHAAKIGYLGSGTASANATRVEALRGGLRELGWVEDRNVVIEFRWADDVAQLPALAAELARMKVDVIFANSSTQVEAARQATQAIPIVFANHADPIGVGHVASLSRPGGNITGLSMLLTDLAAKELEILSQALPIAKRLGVLWNPTTPSHTPALRSVEAASEKLGIQLVPLHARSAEDFDGAFAIMAQQRADGFLDVASPVSFVHRTALAELALRHRLPSMFGGKDWVNAGGLMSYGADIDDLYRARLSISTKSSRALNPPICPSSRPPNISS
jgi:putative ABC transport system substrate-binding protein